MVKFSSTREREEMRTEKGREGGAPRKTMKRHEQNDPSENEEKENKNEKRYKNHLMPTQMVVVGTICLSNTKSKFWGKKEKK